VSTRPVTSGIAYFDAVLDRMPNGQRAVAASWSKVPSMTPDRRPGFGAWRRRQQTLVAAAAPRPNPVVCPALPSRSCAPVLHGPFPPCCRAWPALLHPARCNAQACWPAGAPAPMLRRQKVRPWPGRPSTAPGCQPNNNPKLIVEAGKSCSHLRWPAPRPGLASRSRVPFRPT